MQSEGLNVRVESLWSHGFRNLPFTDKNWIVLWRSLIRIYWTVIVKVLDTRVSLKKTVTNVLNQLLWNKIDKVPHYKRRFDYLSLEIDYWWTPVTCCWLNYIYYEVCQFLVLLNIKLYRLIVNKFRHASVRIKWIQPGWSACCSELFLNASSFSIKFE